MRAPLPPARHQRRKGRNRVGFCVCPSCGELRARALEHAGPIGPCAAVTAAVAANA
jgi:hypothetical protein